MILIAIRKNFQFLIAKFPMSFPRFNVYNRRDVVSLMPDECLMLEYSEENINIEPSIFQTKKAI